MTDPTIRQEVLDAGEPMPVDIEVAWPAPSRATARIPQRTAAGHTAEAGLVEVLT
ncbi:hypothetical protein [Streptosporangium pseudovulgare]|uniref:hypothetical protein n=1 Tax=Streptosporangium pseudovulgare TaxID=35765 RepID=UPI0016711E13|nr:hypothetical protein [Streptosporangium pseudovulgare]